MASSVITIPKRVTGHEELVVIPKREYEALKKAHLSGTSTFTGYETHTWKGKKHKVPVYQLRGKATERLDMRVREAMREYQAGKTISASSIDEALRMYARKKNKVERRLSILI